jgi:hypothetical protein
VKPWLIMLGVATLAIAVTLRAQGPMPPAANGKAASDAEQQSGHGNMTAPASHSPLAAKTFEELAQGLINRVAADPAPNTTTPSAQPVTPPPASQPIQPLLVPTDEPTNPNIVLDVPQTATVATIIVCSASRSTNFRTLRWVIVPAVAFYPDPRLNPNPREIVFAAKDDGPYTVTLRATSPDGGMDERTEVVLVGEGTGPAPARQAMAYGPPNYRQWAANNVGLIKSASRKADLGVMAGAFRAAESLIGNKGIRTIDELENFTELDIDKGLGTFPDGRPGPEVEACRAFRDALSTLTKNDARLKDIGTATQGLDDLSAALLSMSR